jgi:molybdenum cofactor guanylyltransferase
MLGLIVCGGRSSRMGSDKGLLMSGGKRWSEIAFEKLNFLQGKVMVSIHTRQLETYLPFFESEQLIVDADLPKVAGPLAGILSTHMCFPEEDIVVLACDMIQMQSALPEELVDIFKKGNREACVYMNEGRVEPLCAVYAARGLAKISARSAHHQLANHSLMHVLEILDAQYVVAPPGSGLQFRNYNAPEDLITT